MHKISIVSNGAKKDLDYYNMITKRINLGDIVKKENSVSVPYRNGKLYTNLGAGNIYDERIITLNILAYGKNPEIDYSDFVNFINYEECNLYIDAIPNYHFVGRFDVGALKTEHSKYSFTLTMRAHPYMYKNTITTVVLATNKTEWNGHIRAYMPCLPTIILGKSTSVRGTINETSFTISGTGEHKLTIPLNVGVNSYTFKCSSSLQTIKIQYQEGKL